LPAGAFLTEGGVHFLAGLRMAAKASGFGEAVAAVAASAGISPDLPHPDTVAGTLWFEKGVWAFGTVLVPRQCIHAAVL
jgi:hypothetical protein